MARFSLFASTHPASGFFLMRKAREKDGDLLFAEIPSC